MPRGATSGRPEWVTVDQSPADVLPQPRFAHLRRLTGRHGLWEHAVWTTPRTEHGYCTDDNARALIVLSRQPEPSEELLELTEVYLEFLRHARLAGGGFSNRRSSDGSWVDEVGSDDSQGRALWALGTVARRGPAPWMRQVALDMFDEADDLDSPSPRANAFAVLGAAEALDASSTPARAEQILERCIAGVPQPRDDERWPWPEDRLGYDNARIPQSLMAAGAQMGDDALADAGLLLLEWLVEIETRDDHFSFVPVGGWAPGEPRPGFDQQPIEAAAMADACSSAWALTDDDRWVERLERALRWFVADNDVGAVLYDARTGGCRDGLTPDGANQNQGAESTLAALAALQHAEAVR